MPDLQLTNQIDEARSVAAGYEAALEPTRRKRFGQFFTGLPLSRLLAAVALDGNATTVIDPMAGHGDLLDAVAERAAGRNLRLVRLQAVEIDTPTAAVCRQRLEVWEDLADVVSVRPGDAFDPSAAREYSATGYDLVITNPPYVRYQTLAAQNGDAPQLASDIRRRLLEIVTNRVPQEEQHIWQTLIDKYSGFADLSVPAWILCAALVQPGGVLALVAPATWRSRDYGDVIEYLLAKCFRLEYLIEDTQPGWFSDALVRTQLVVARRLPAVEARIPLSERSANDGVVLTVKVSPPASGNGSLVGSSFPDDDPEAAFATWLRDTAEGKRRDAVGLVPQSARLADTLESAAASGGRRSWFRSLEPTEAIGSLFEDTLQSPPSLVPAALRPLLNDTGPTNLVLPKAAGLSISQGLRTGCNGFFYVDHLEDTPGGFARVRLSGLFNHDEIKVPKGCLVPVVRRQSEVSGPVEAAHLTGRALDLSAWVLPEDAGAVERAKHQYEREGAPVPQMMPAELAGLVRRAAQTVHTSGHDTKRIHELSAVKTNVRAAGGERPPRFWYMLPPFARRHRPDAFVARVNQSIPWVERNDDSPVLIDANFSTIWAQSGHWSPFSIWAVLNSVWCQACMEALGTPMGGGALKLEATQLKRLPLPALSDADLAMLDTAAKALPANTESVPEEIDRFIVAEITGFKKSAPAVDALLKGLRGLADTLCRERQKQRA